MRSRHDMPFGAALAPTGGVDFRLWGPAARRVELALDAGVGMPPRLVPAACDADGWWECHVADATAGTLYRWHINGELLVPDPASRQNPHGVMQPSCVVDPAQFEWDEDWTGRPWSEVVLYEMHVGAFTPEGTFAAAGERLEDLARLGITALQVMPVAQFPGRFGWGYDGVLPFAPQPAYGTPDEFKHFIQQAHRLGLMVFLDVVYNHFGPAGNYLGQYAPQFFSETHASPWGAAINFDGGGSRVVRDFFIHNALYWVQEYRIDGLRLDAVHAIVDRSRPDVVEEISRAVRAATRGRHVHLVLENENNHHGRLSPTPRPGRFDGQWNDDFHHALHVTLTGETRGYYHDYGREPLNLLARALTHGLLYEPSERQPGGARREPREAPPQPLGTMVNCANNHDQSGNRALGERLGQLVPPGAAPLALLLSLLTPATPMLFFGDEFGTDSPFRYFADWHGELRDAVRRGRQREFGHMARAADGTPVELPDPCDAATFEASRPDRAHARTPEGRRALQLVAAALAVRREHIAPRQPLLLTGQHTAQRLADTGLRVCWRYRDGQILMLEINLGSQPLHVPLATPPLAQARELLHHAWPEGTPDEVWPAWAARWLMGAPAV
ncbi:malto-oligosyltrehalose trehalohydrolase [Ramlibacter sp.]|uniref:malto-oligosyltrehalose trehalohydrolase n=1 Tax=Ramlibacter sp. TaxID=1917967 RepID=UPI002BAFB471|nr:malto-oligosyltrehalose trehalohydrolase [Ramlibacter sp.]HWI80405.1 malto-oligosyltrehalose trehalohydrolase [Ramlibacter sp.]